jgi:hypothetical protein
VVVTVVGGGDGAAWKSRRVAVVRRCLLSLGGVLSALVAGTIVVVAVAVERGSRQSYSTVN